MKWTRLAGIDYYSDSGFVPAPKAPIFTHNEKWCEKWLVNTYEQLKTASCYQLELIEARKIGPRQYFVLYQLWSNWLHKSSVIQEWFGTACCKKAAIGKAFQEHYEDNYV